MKPMRVLITGAAGHVGSSLVYRVAAGDLFGLQQPVILHLYDIENTLPDLKGEMMELGDCAFPLLKDVVVTTEIDEAFADVDVAFLIGAFPRRKGMERRDLLEANGKIFPAQGKALNDYANPDVRVVVVGNPANTNCLIAAKNAPDLDPSQFTALTRLDHNRGMGMLASKLGCHVTDITKFMIWGNHSNTQFPDISHALFKGKPVSDLIDFDWYENEFIPGVQQRGSEILRVRGMSSTVSAAICTIKHFKSWYYGTNDNDWVSKAVYSTGNPYGIADDLYYSFPVTCDSELAYSIVKGLEINEFCEKMMRISEKELLAERDIIRDLL